MKIVLATGLYPPETDGDAPYVRLLEAELPGRGIEVVTVSFGSVRHYPPVIRHVLYAWKVWRVSKKAAGIYALDSVSVGFPAAWVAKLIGKPFLIRLSGDCAWEQGRAKFGLTQTLDEYSRNHSAAPWQVRILARLQSYLVSQSIRVIVPSKYFKSVVTQWGVAAEKVTVVYNALHPLEVSGSRDSLRSELEYSYPTLVSAAQLVPWKGFRVLIEVLSNLKEKYPDITLVIIGEGAERRSLESQVMKQGLQEHVYFTGQVSKEALGTALKAADVFVLNTAYENLSQQLVEVMDVGVPIVTTKSGGNPELITNGVNGYLIDYNDPAQLQEAIVRVLSHPESRERMTQSARLRSKDFQKNTVVEETVSMMKNILVEK